MATYPDPPKASRVTAPNDTVTIPWWEWFVGLARMARRGAVGASTAGAGAAMAAASATLEDEDMVGPIGVPGTRGKAGPIGPSGPSRFGPPGFDGDDFDDVYIPIPGPRGGKGNTGAAGASGTVRGRTGPPGQDAEEGVDGFSQPGQRGVRGFTGGIPLYYDSDPTTVAESTIEFSFKMNAAFAVDVTEILLWQQAIGGEYFGALIDVMDDARSARPGTIVIQSASRPGVQLVYDVVPVVSGFGSDSYLLPVIFVEGGTFMPLHGERCVFQFVRNGERGIGRVGPPGFDGLEHDVELLGFPGGRGRRGAAGARGRGAVGMPGLDGEDGYDGFEIPGKRGKAGSAGGGGGSATRAVVVASFPARLEQAVTVVDATVAATSKVNVWASGLGPNVNGTSDGVDLEALDVFAGTGSFQLRIHTATPWAGALSVDYTVSA